MQISAPTPLPEELPVDACVPDDAVLPPSEPAPPEEHGGRGGLDPTRYGDWEKNGRCIDF
ncbi:MAG: DUF1674 domain-containing protein [Dokdonella sp.]